MTSFFVVMGGIILLVSAIAVFDWITRRKDRNARSRAV